MASDTTPESWAKLREAKSIEKQRKKLEDLRGKIARERSADLSERVGSTGNDVGERIRAVIQGDVETHSPAARQAASIKDALIVEQANLLTELNLLRPRYERATQERDAHLTRMKKWSNDTIGAKIPSVQGSRWTLFAAVLSLVVLESVMLRRPAESLIRQLFPELGSVTGPGFLMVAAFTLFSAMILALTGRAWKEFNTASARAKIAAESDDTSAVPTPSLAGPLAWSAAALATQTVLAVLRLQVDTDSSTARGTITLFSILLLFLAFTIVLIEYRLHDPVDQTRVTWDEDTIATYLGMWTRAYTHIPREIASTERVRLEATKAAISDQQRIAPSIDDGGEILGALNEYMDEINGQIAAVKLPEFADLPDDSGNHFGGSPSDGKAGYTYPGPVADDEDGAI